MHSSSHPTPLLERDHWRSLDGLWRFCFDDDARWQHPREVVFDREIRVPYAPESRRSGVHDEGFHPVVWYSLTLTLPRMNPWDSGSRYASLTRLVSLTQLRGVPCTPPAAT